jgi:SPP1 gp7 family putative phage head morphogenesis protein
MIEAKVIHYPKYEEVKYKVALLKYVDFIERQIKLLVYPILDTLSERGDSIRLDDFSDDIEEALNAVKAFVDIKTTILISGLIKRAREVTRFTTRQVINSLRGLQGLISVQVEPLFGVDIFNSYVNPSLDELTKSWAITNTRLINSIPETMLNDVSIVIQTGYRAGSSMTYIKNQITDKFNIAENRAKLIARDQIGKLHSNIIKDEHLRLGITQYRWLTSQDERVRQSHRVMSNKICQWSNETTYKNNVQDKNWNMRSSIGGVQKQVGEDFQCRCSPIAIIK